METQNSHLLRFIPIFFQIACAHSIPSQFSWNMNIFSSPNYRGAIALNNFAVALLHRHSYRQAIDTLKDAVAIMCSVLRDDRQINAIQVNEKLANASYRLAHSNVSECDAIKIQVVTQHGISRKEYEGMASTKNCYAVRIEDFAPDLRDADLESSILLHNFALAHYCLARTENGSQRVRLGEGALKLSMSAYRVVNGLTFDRRSPRSAVEQSSVCFFTVLIVSTYAHILSDMGKNNEAKETDEKLATLRLLMHHKSEEYCLETLTAAAA